MTVGVHYIGLFVGREYILPVATECTLYRGQKKSWLNGTTNGKAIRNIVQPRFCTLREVSCVRRGGEMRVRVGKSKTGDSRVSRRDFAATRARDRDNERRGFLDSNTSAKASNARARANGTWVTS